MYVLKEKLKKVKVRPKELEQICLWRCNTQIVELEKRIQYLDGKDDEAELSVEDREERRQNLTDLGQVRVKQG